MFGFLWKMVPMNYKWSVATKNIGLGLGKVATSLLAGHFGKVLAPEHINAVGVVVTIVTQAGLEWLHDWAAVKWPNAKWL